MLVELKNISKRLGSFHLEDISIELPEGYIMGLIGPNGAGKTSLLHIILGLYEADVGHVAIDGKSYADEEVQIREEIGAVLLEDLFDDGRTLRDNGAAYGRFFREYRQELFEEYLVRFQLDGKRKYHALSRGERIKLQFAFALSHNAKLLVLDEPTGNLDREFRQDFFQILKEFIGDGKRSVILSTHLTEDLDRIADYILYLENGRSIFAGDIETLREEYRMVAGAGHIVRAIPKELVIHMEETAHGCARDCCGACIYFADHICRCGARRRHDASGRMGAGFDRLPYGTACAFYHKVLVLLAPDAGGGDPL